MASSSKRFTRVLTPDPSRVTREDLLKPFILYGFLPQLATLTHVVSIPNILDVMGLPSGGGLPGFCFVIEAFEDEPTKPRLFAGYIPGTCIPQIGATPVGVTTTAGIILQWCELAWSVPHVLTALEEAIKAEGYSPIPLVPYITPEYVLQGKLKLSAQSADLTENKEQER